MTRDAGKNWANVTPPGIGEFNRISLIEASPHEPGGAYVAAKRNQMDDRPPYIFKTKDYGKTWTKIVDGLGGNDFVHAVREDPKRAGLLFAGTEHCVSVSIDDGAEWQSLALNLPDTQVSDLVVEQDDLVIATHGRSFYVLDDIGAFRQVSPRTTVAPAFLFEPRPVLRGFNQPVIDYWLSAPAPEVRLEILDESNLVIRTFTRSATAARPSTGTSEDETPGAGAGILTTEIGINRFVWDLRYAGPVTFPGIVLRGATPGLGPQAPPGRYTVRLTANGVTAAQPLIVRPDPRIPGVTAQQLNEQFRLAMEIARKSTEAHGAVLTIRTICAQLDDRAKSTPQIAETTVAIKAKLGEVEGDLYQVRNRSPRDTLNFPIKLNNQLALLQQ